MFLGVGIYLLVDNCIVPFRTNRYIYVTPLNRHPIHVSTHPPTHPPTQPPTQPPTPHPLLKFSISLLTIHPSID